MTEQKAAYVPPPSAEMQALSDDQAKSAPTSCGPVNTSVRAGEPAEPRELLGRLVRQVWVQWAQEQPEPKPSWLVGWDQLDDGQREVDMRIGKALFDAGYRAGRVVTGERLGSLLHRAADGEDPAALYAEAVTFDD